MTHPDHLGGFRPGEYLCIWQVTNPDGSSIRVHGVLELEGGRAPNGWAYGTEIQSEAMTDPPPGFAEAHGFPQYRQERTVRAELSTGEVCTLVDVLITVWPERILFRAGMGLAGPTFPAEQVAVSEARIQTTGLDALSGVRPLVGYKWPKHGSDNHDFTVTRNPTGPLRWHDEEVGEATFEYVGRTRIGAPFGFSLMFAPRATVSLYEAQDLGEFLDSYVLPLTVLTQLATNRAERVTWLRVGGETVTGDYGEWQVFASWIDQEAYLSDTDLMSQGEPLFHLTDNSLLDLFRTWKRQTSALHPLAETFARNLALVLQQPPRNQVLTACQSFEGWYNHEHKAEVEARQEKHAESRARALLALDRVDIGDADRKFIKKNLGRRPTTNLASYLRWADGQLGGRLQAELEQLDIVQEIIRVGTPTGWSEALRSLRNDLSHGNREYPSHQLEELALPLIAQARIAALQVLGARTVERPTSR